MQLEKTKREHKSKPIISKSAKVFAIFNIVILTFLGLLCFVPFWYEICVSFSSNDAINAKEVMLWPKEFTLEAYQYVMKRVPFWKAIWTTCLRVFISLPLSLFLMITASYPLSKSNQRFRFRGIYVWYFFITMLFNGGMIPLYLVVVQLNLINSIWSLVLPGCVNVFNMLLILSFFRNIPIELEEAALVDGASQWRILWKIFVPLSMPVIATVTLFTVVGNWNSWFDGMIYMKESNYPLQTYLRTIVFNYNFGNMTLSEQQELAKMSSKAIKAAQMTIGAIPILMIYPFLQKYFVKGITLGGVKG